MNLSHSHDRRLRRRHEQGRVHRARRMFFETLHPRLMLAADMLVNASSGNDEIVIKSGAVAGMITVESTNGTFAAQTFTVPTNSLKIDGLGGDDTVTIQSLELGSASLEILGETIRVVSGATVRSSGDITFTATKSGIAELENLSPVLVPTKITRIAIGSGAVISGNDISISASSTDETFTDQLPAAVPNVVKELLIDQLVDPLTDFLALPFKVLVKKSDASIQIDPNVRLVATGGVSLEASSVSDATGKAASKFFSAGYVSANSSAVIDIRAGVTITAEESVDITSDAEATASISSETSRELGAFPSGSSSTAASVAVSKADIKSHTLIANGASITAGGSVAITASGTQESSAEAESGLYEDGRAGLAFGLDFSNADIQSKVGGTITARVEESDPTSFEFDPTTSNPNQLGFIDAAADTIFVGAHGFSTGDTVTYGNGRGANVGTLVFPGLTHDQEYYVITTANPNKIRLAESEAAAKAGNAINLGAGATLNRKSFDLAKHVDSATNTIHLSNPLGSGSGLDFTLLGNTFAQGQAVRYDALGGTPLRGLTNGATYYVIVESNEFNLDGDSRFVGTQSIQLAETAAEADAGIALDLDAAQMSGTHRFSALHTLDSGAISGIAVTASLEASDSATANAGIERKDDTEDDEEDDEEEGGTAFDQLFDKLSGGHKDNASKADSGATTSGLKTAGAFSFVKADHRVRATIDQNAVLKSNEDLTVTTEITEAHQQRAETNIETTADSSAKESALSAAVIVGLVNNTAQTTVGSNSSLDALRALKIGSDVSYPMLARPDELLPNSLGELIDVLKSEGPNLAASTAREGPSALSDYLKEKIDLKSQMFNTWAFSGGKAGGVSVAGSVNYLEFNNASDAIVQADVQINQDLAFRDPVSNPHANNEDQQVVVVEATLSVQTLNVTGVFEFKQKPSGEGTEVSPTASGTTKGGIGGAILVSLSENSTQALVDRDAHIYTGSGGGLFVNAAESLLTFYFSQAGAGAGQYGIGGTVGYVEQASRTHARLAGGAVVTGGKQSDEIDDAGSPVTVSAVSQATSINWAGAVAKGKNLGMGITVARNNIERDTQALIGNLDPAVDPVRGSAPSLTTHLRASGDLQVEAKNDGALWAFSVAAASAGGSSPPASGTQGEAPVENKDGKKAKFGIGISANVSLNTVTDHVTALIRDAGEIHAPAISVSAENETDLTAWSAAASVVLKDASASSGGSKKSAAIAGSFSQNELTGKTHATIQGHHAATDKRLLLRPDGSLSLSAERAGKLQAITAGLGVSTESGGNSFVAAGSVALNKIANDTQAQLRGVQDDPNPATPEAPADKYELSILAEDRSAIFSLAGSLSIGLGGGNLGVGLSFAQNTITSRSVAEIDAANLNHVDTSNVSVTQHADIRAITITGALAAGDENQIAIAGSLARNEIRGTAVARVANSSLRARGKVSVSATDTSSIEADGGGVSIAAARSRQGSAATGAIGFALADNSIGDSDSRVAAQVDHSEILAEDVSVIAGSTAQIGARSIAGALAAASSSGGTSGALAGAGAAAVNTIRGGVEARVRGTRSANPNRGVAARELTVRATDASTITADVVGASVALAAGSGTSGAVSIGLSIAHNEIDNRVEAFLEKAAVAVNGGAADRNGITVSVTETATITATSVAASLSAASGKTGLSLSGGGADATNVILTKANAFVDDSVLTSERDVAVTTHNTARIKSNVVAASAAIGVGSTAGAVSIGAARARNFIGWKQDGSGSAADSQAFLKNSPTTAADLTVQSTAHQAIEALVVAGSAAVSAASSTGIGLSGAGVDVTNKIRGRIRAFIDGDTLPTANGIRVSDLTLTADDRSSISATAVGASLAAAAGGGSGGTISVGVSLAHNEIDNDVAAYLQNATTVTTGSGNLSISATSQGQKRFDLNAVGSQLITADELDDATVTDEDDPATAVNEVTIDQAADATVVSKLRSQFVSHGTTMSNRLILTSIDPGSRWTLVDADRHEAYTITRRADGGLEVSKTTIQAMALAASVAVGAGGSFGGGVSGAGASATNVILTDTVAYIARSGVTSGGDVSVDAASSQSILATIIAASLGVGAGGAGGVGASIGASLAENYIGFDDEGRTDAVRAAEIRAYVEDSSITATGALAINALAQQAIGAVVFAGSAAIAGGGTGAVGLSGSGVSATNKIGAVVQAYVAGDGSRGITAAHVEAIALDRSSIKADAGAVSLAASFAGTGAVSVSIGIALAANEISNEVAAFIRDVDQTLTTTNGDVVLNASETAAIRARTAAAAASVAISGGAGIAIAGAGAKATNVILGGVQAYVADSRLQSANQVLVNASNLSSIDALVISAAASLGIGGGAGGAVSIGASFAENAIGFDANGAKSPLRVHAFADESVISAASRVALDARTREQIRATTFAGSVAIAGGTGAAAGAGSGVNTTNRIANEVLAYLDGDDQNVTGSSVSLNAQDLSLITADAAAASIAAAVGVGGAVAIAVTLAENVIDNDVEAAIRAGDVTARSGGVSITAISEPTINSSGTAGGVSAGLVAGTAAGVQVKNSIGGSTNAAMQSGQLTTTGSLTVNSRSKAMPSVVGAGLAAAAGFGGAIGVVQTEATSTGVTAASIGGTITARSLDVHASGTGVVKAKATAASGGLLAAGVNTASASLTSQVLVSLADDSKVKVQEDARFAAIGSMTGEAKSMGTSVGALAVGLSRADLTLRPTVHTTVGDGVVVEADGRITFSSHLEKNEGTVMTTASGGSLLGASGAISKQTVSADVATEIGDESTLHGASGVTVTSQSEVRLSDRAVVDTKGGVSLQRAEAKEAINTSARTILGTRSRLVAERGIVNVHSQNQVDVISQTATQFLGLGSGAQATAETTIGGQGSSKLAETVLGAGSSISGFQVNVGANVARITVDSDAHGEQYAAFGFVETSSTSSVDSTAIVEQQSGVSITARDIVLDSRHGTVEIHSFGEYDGFSAVAEQRGNVTAQVQLLSELNIAEGAELAAHTIDVAARGATGRVDAGSSLDATALIPIDSVRTGTAIDSDATLLVAGKLLPGTNAAHLFIDATGRLAFNQSLAGSNLVVGNVIDGSGAKIAALAVANAPSLKITAAKSTLNPGSTDPGTEQTESITIPATASYAVPDRFTEVSIENRSSKNLEIGSLDVMLPFRSVSPIITPAPDRPLTSDGTRELTEVEVSIRSIESPDGANIFLDGSIHNPEGRIVIHTTGGSILDRNADPATRIHTANLDLTAGSSIGDAANPVQAKIEHANSTRTLRTSAGGNVAVTLANETQSLDVLGVEGRGGNVSLDFGGRPVRIEGPIRAGSSRGITIQQVAAVEDQNDDGPDLVAQSLVVLGSTGNFGTQENPLETLLEQLEVVTTGGLYAANQRALTIGGIGNAVGLQAGGAIHLETAQSMMVAERVEAAGSVRLVVPDQIHPTANQVALAANVQIVSTGGDVALLAGDVFSLQPGQKLIANQGAGRVTIGIDWENADPGTTTFTVPREADAIFVARELRIVGSTDRDVLVVPDLYMPITFEGHAGTDRVDVTLLRAPSLATRLAAIDTEETNFRHDFDQSITWLLDTDPQKHDETLFDGIPLERVSESHLDAAGQRILRTMHSQDSGFNALDARYRFGSSATTLTILAMRHPAHVELQDADDKVTVGGFRPTSGVAEPIHPGLVERRIQIDARGGNDTFELLEPRSGSNTVPVGRIDRTLDGGGLVQDYSTSQNEGSTRRIEFRGFEAATVDLGAGDDQGGIDSIFTVLDTVIPTTILAGKGNDTVNIRKLSAPTVVRLEEGDDTVNLQGGGPSLANLAPLLTLWGGELNEKPTTEVDGGDRLLFGSTRTFNSSSVLPADVTVDVNHAVKLFGTGWERGEPLLFTTDGIAPAGLEPGVIYFAVPYGRDVIRLAKTREDALQAALTPISNDPRIIPLTSRGEGNHQLTLTKNGQPQWPVMEGSLVGSDRSPVLSYTTPGTGLPAQALFVEFERLNVLLGLGDDRFTLGSPTNPMEITDLRIEVRGGPGNDEFPLYQLPGGNTVILGESGENDRIRVIAPETLVPEAFTNLTISAGIETLVADHRAGIAPVDWVVSQGTLYFVDGLAEIAGFDPATDEFSFSGFTAPVALENGDRVLLSSTAELPHHRPRNSPVDMELDRSQFYVVSDLNQAAGTFRLTFPGGVEPIDLVLSAVGTLSLRRISAFVSLEGAARTELWGAEAQDNTLSVVTPLNTTVQVLGDQLTVIEGARVLDHHSNLAKGNFPVGRVDGLAGVQSVVASQIAPFVFAAGIDDDQVAIFMRVPDPSSTTGSKLVFVNSIDSLHDNVPDSPSKLALSPDDRFLYVLGASRIGVFAVMQNSDGKPQLAWQQDVFEISGSIVSQTQGPFGRTTESLPRPAHLTLKLSSPRDLTFSRKLDASGQDIDLGTHLYVTDAGSEDGIVVLARDVATGRLTEVIQKLRKANSFGKSVDVGNAAVDRPFAGPLSDGNLVILDEPFMQSITSQGTYRLRTHTASRITPVLLKPRSEDDHSDPDNLNRWEIVARGTERIIPTAGVHEFEFGLTNGSVSGTGLYFGWVDGGNGDNTLTAVYVSTGLSSSAFHVPTTNLSGGLQAGATSSSAQFRQGWSYSMEATFEVAAVRGLDNPISIAISNDGTTLYTGDEAGDVAAWVEQPDRTFRLATEEHWFRETVTGAPDLRSVDVSFRNDRMVSVVSATGSRPSIVSLDTVFAGNTHYRVHSSGRSLEYSINGGISWNAVVLGSCGDVNNPVCVNIPDASAGLRGAFQNTTFDLDAGIASLATNGDYLFVGLPMADRFAAFTSQDLPIHSDDSGVVLIFKKIATVADFDLHQVIADPSFRVDAGFGSFVALDGNLAAITLTDVANGNSSTQLWQHDTASSTWAMTEDRSFWGPVADVDSGAVITRAQFGATNIETNIYRADPNGNFISVARFPIDSIAVTIDGHTATATDRQGVVHVLRENATGGWSEVRTIGGTGATPFTVPISSIDTAPSRTQFRVTGYKVTNGSDDTDDGDDEDLYVNFVGRSTETPFYSFPSDTNEATVTNFPWVTVDNTPRTLYFRESDSNGEDDFGAVRFQASPTLLPPSATVTALWYDIGGTSGNNFAFSCDDLGFVQPANNTRITTYQCDIRSDESSGSNFSTNRMNVTLEVRVDRENETTHIVTDMADSLGDLIAIGERKSGSNRAFDAIEVFIESAQQSNWFPANGAITGLAVSPDGRTVYAADDAGSVLVLGQKTPSVNVRDVESLKRVPQQVFATPTTQNLVGASSLSLSPDGRRVFVTAVGESGAVTLFERRADNTLFGDRELIPADPVNDHQGAADTASEPSSDPTRHFVVAANSVANALTTFLIQSDGSGAVVSASSDQGPNPNGLGGLADGNPFDVVTRVQSLTANPVPSTSIDSARQTFYAVSPLDNLLFVLNRDAQGNTQVVQRLKDDMIGDLGFQDDSLAGAAKIAVSPNGEFVYIAAINEGTAGKIAVYQRAVPATGTPYDGLKFVAEFPTSVFEPNLADPVAALIANSRTALAVAPDGTVYVSGPKGLEVFAADALQGLSSNPPDAFAYTLSDLKFAEDSATVYAVGHALGASADNRLWIWNRSGIELNVLSQTDTRLDDPRGLEVSSRVAVPGDPEVPAGRFIYVASAGNSSLSVFDELSLGVDDVMDGRVHHRQIVREGVQGIRGLGGVSALKLSAEVLDAKVTFGNDELDATSHTIDLGRRHGLKTGQEVWFASGIEAPQNIVTPVQPGTAVFFDGQNTDASVPDDRAHRPSEITLEAWVKPTAGVSNRDAVIAKTDPNEQNKGYGLQYEDNGIVFFLNNDRQDRVAAPIPLDAYSHVVGTYDGATMRLYVDGVEVATKDYTRSINHVTQPLFVGGGRGFQTWTGSLDEVAMYGTVLTASQVANHYAQRTDRISYVTTVLADAPIVYYSLEESGGTVAKDHSGNGYDGTFRNNPVFGAVSAFDTGIASVDQSYFVRVLDEQRFQLFGDLQSTIGLAELDDATHTVETLAPHGLRTGLGVVFRDPLQLPGGAVLGTEYFVRVLDAQRYQLYTTAVAAQTGDATALAEIVNAIGPSTWTASLSGAATARAGDELFLTKIEPNPSLLGSYIMRAKSPAGAHLYAAGQDGNSLTVLQRDLNPSSPTVGQLTFLQVIKNNVGNATGGANFGLFRPDSIVALAQDASSVYVSSSFDPDITDSPGGFVTLHNNASDSPALPPIETILRFANIKSIAVNTGAGRDFITVDRAPAPGSDLSISTGRGQDSVALNDAGEGTTTKVDLGPDDDEFTILTQTASAGSASRSSHGEARIEVDTGDGADTVRITKVAGNTTLQLTTESPAGDPANAWVDQVNVNARGITAGSAVTVNVGDGGANGDQVNYQVGGDETSDDYSNPEGTQFQLANFGSFAMQVNGAPGQPQQTQSSTPATTPLAKTAGVITIAEGSGLTLTSQSSLPTDRDCETDPLCFVRYAWDLNGDGSFTELETTQPQVTLTWQDLVEFGMDQEDLGSGQANRRVTLRISRVLLTLDGQGQVDPTQTVVQSSDADLLITIQDVLPTVSLAGASPFTASLAGAEYRLNINATDPGNDRVTRWHIDWKDGTTDTFGPQSVPSHRYQRPGTYAIEVSGIDENGTVIPPTTKTVEIRFDASSLDHGGPYVIDEGRSLVLRAAAAGLPDANSYRWSFSQGGSTKQAPAGGLEQTLDWSSLQTLGVTNDGLFDVTLSTNYGGTVVSTTTTLTVRNVAPTATFDQNGPVNQGQPATVRFVNLADPNDLAALQFSYDFGDGFQPGTASQIIPTSTAGARLIRARVNDGTDTVDYSTTVVIRDLPPQVKVSGALASLIEVKEGDTAKLTGTFSNPGGGPLTFNTSFGAVIQDAARGTWSWSHTPADNTSQPQAVTITATDAEGSQANVAFQLAVSNVAPRGVLVLPADVREGDTGVTARLTGVTDASSADAAAGFSYFYDFGDGQGFVSGGATQTIPNAVVARSGSFPIRARIVDKDGGTTELAQTLSVANSVATLQSLSATPDQIRSAAPVVLNGTFGGDTGVFDRHTVEIDWGDGFIDRLSATNVVGITARGSGYVDNPAVAVTGGSGSGMTLTIRTNGGQVVEAIVNQPGSGYQSLDVLTINGGDARVTLGAFHQSAGTFTALHSYAYGNGNLANPTAIKVTISDADGGQDTQTLSANVVGAPRIITTSKVLVNDGQTAVIDVEATDPGGATEGNGLTYRLTGGADLAQFSILPASGVLTFKTAPDAKALADANRDNVYDIRVMVVNPLGLTDVRDFAVTVVPTKVENQPPRITTAASVAVPENQRAVVDVQSVDPDGQTEGNGLAYQLTGGADRNFFSVIASSGVLTFDAAPNFENPRDTGGDNRYDVQVTVTDLGGLTSVLDLVVEVTDVNEAPGVPSLTLGNLRENLSGWVIGPVVVVDEDLGDSHQLTVNDARFEILEGVLKLKEGVSVRLADGATIAIQVTALDSGSPALSSAASAVFNVLANPTPWQFTSQPVDTNGDGSVVPLDALRVINQLNNPVLLGPGGRLPTDRAAAATIPFYDVNGDGFCTTNDVLRVINFLNGPAGEGEGHAAVLAPRVVSTAVPSDAKEAVDPQVAIYAWDELALDADPRCLFPMTPPWGGPLDEFDWNPHGDSIAETLDDLCDELSPWRGR